MKSFISFVAFSLVLLSLLDFSASTVYTDTDICRTDFTGCLKCTDESEKNCYICKEGWKLKLFSGIVTSSAIMESFEGICISAVDTYSDWHSATSSNSKIEGIEQIADVLMAQEQLNLFIQIFDNSNINPTLDMLERATVASSVKSQMLEKFKSKFTPASDNDVLTIFYGCLTLLQIEHNLFEEIGFIPDELKTTVVDDLTIIVEILEELKTNMFTAATFGDYILSLLHYKIIFFIMIIDQGLTLLDIIMKYYEFKVLDISGLPTLLQHKLFKEQEEWVQTQDYFPNGKPSEIDEYMLSLAEEDFKSLFSEETCNIVLFVIFYTQEKVLQTKVDLALHNLIVQYSYFNPKVLTKTFNMAEFSIVYIRNWDSSSLLRTKFFSITIPNEALTQIAEDNKIEIDQIMILSIVYRYVNAFGDNPEEKMTSVAKIQGYSLKEYGKATEINFPDSKIYSIDFNLNSGTHDWQCLSYNQEWKILSNPTSKDMATITCGLKTFGTIGYQKIVAEDRATWANIGMHCTWFWLVIVGLLCLAKLLFFECFQKQQVEESEGLKMIKFAPFTISMPISLISAISLSDFVYKGLFMLTYFSAICVTLSYNISENSDDEKEAWMDFYTAFRILICVWVLKYFFGSLRIIQKDCFQSQAPLSLILIIVYFVEMYLCQKELGNATNDRQEQWLLTLVTAVIMDLIIDFILAIILSILFVEAKLGLLSFMRLGGFVTLNKTDFSNNGYFPPTKDNQNDIIQTKPNEKETTTLDQDVTKH